MKNWIIVLLLVLLTGFSTERFYRFRMTESQANYHWQNIENLKLFLDHSTLPHSQVKLALNAIDSLQKDLQSGLTIDSTASLK